MAGKTSTMRLRSVRFKSGGELRVLHPKQDFSVRDTFRNASFRIGTTECSGEMAGWAIVCWTRQGRVIVDYENSESSPVPGGGVARYARDVLAAEQAVRWSKP